MGAAARTGKASNAWGAGLGIHGLVPAGVLVGAVIGFVTTDRLEELFGKDRNHQMAS
jgi:hypothetical protein